MTIWPTARPAIRSRIASYRRILRQESESPGGFGDDRGRRFLLFSLYFRLREDTEVCAYIDWYRATFPDDHVFAEQCLCWALILRRLGRLDEAVYRFVQAIDDNIPVVADVVGDLQVPYGIMEDELWQLYRMDETVMAAMTAVPPWGVRPIRLGVGQIRSRGILVRWTALSAKQRVFQMTPRFATATRYLRSPSSTASPATATATVRALPGSS